MYISYKYSWYHRRACLVERLILNFIHNSGDKIIQNMQGLSNPIDTSIESKSTHNI